MSGLHFPNPFIIGSGPPGENATAMIKAFKAGWGGVVGKTYSLASCEVINVKPRYAKLRNTKGIVGFQNIELISDETCEDWMRWNEETKNACPDGILIASIMESPEKGKQRKYFLKV
jgi:dihydroorotate dehydrogenase